MEEDIRNYLLPGEQLVWWGAPKRGVMLTSRDLFLVPFSLLWGGFAIFWEANALRMHAPIFFPVFGALFVAVGLFFIFGRFIFDAWLRGGTVYGVTSRRVLIARKGPYPNFVAVSLGQLPPASLSEGANGRGTIRFGEAMRFAWPYGMRGGMSYWTPSLDPTPQFIGIEDARRVFNQIQSATHRGVQA